MAKAFRIESKDSEGNAKILIVKKPNHKQLTEAQFYSSAVFNKAKDAGACLRTKLDDYLRKEGLWTDEEQKLAEEIGTRLDKNLRIIKTGKKEDGTKVKLSEGRQLAIEIKKDRLALNFILSKRREHDAYTVEGHAENARFNHLVANCVFDEDGNKIFTDVDDYYDKQEEPYAYDAASKLAAVTSSIDEDWEQKLPENQFLIKYKFVDKDLRYIDKDGHWVNNAGQRVNEAGQLVNADGKLIDVDGTVIEEVTEADFEDDVYNS
jgi:hypothetical protein